MSRAMRSRWVPIGCVLASLVLGTAYAMVVPPWEAPDEPWHLAYAESLAAGRLPMPAETYEAHQPPLGYAWTGLAVRASGLGRLPRSPDNPWFPYAQAALWHEPGDPAKAWLPWLRTFSGLPVALLVALAWATARALAPGSPGASTAAAVLAALWPQMAFVSHAIGNDLLAAVSGALIVHGLVVWVARARAWSVAGMLLCAGGALVPLAKLNVVAVAAVVPVVALLQWRWAGKGSGVVRALVVPPALTVAGLGLGCALLAVVAPSTMRLMVDQALWRGLTFDGAAVSWRTLPGQLALTAESTWARYGWLNVALPAAAKGLSALALGLAAMAVGRRWVIAAAHERRVVSPLLLALAAMAAATLKNLAADPQPQGRLLFPAFTAMVVALAWGMSGRPRGKARSALGGLAAMGLLAVNVYALASVIPGAYAHARGPMPGVAVRVVPPRPERVAHLDRDRLAARQTFLAGPSRLASVSVALARAVGGGVLAATVVAGDREIGRDRWPVGGRGLGDVWLTVDVGGRSRSVVAGETVEVVVRYEEAEAGSRADFWGSRGDVLAGGALWTCAAGGGCAGDCARPECWRLESDVDLAVLALEE